MSGLRLPAGINAWSNKTEQSIYRCLLGFCFNNIFCAPQNFGCIDSFFCPIPETKRNDGWWFPLVLLLPVCLNGKRLLSTSCNKQGQRSSRWHFHGVPMHSSQNRMCRKLNKPATMSWNFILLMLHCVSGAMNRHCIPGLAMSTALTGNFSARGVSGNN